MTASSSAAFVWEDPGDSIMIQLGLEVVQRLRAKLSQGPGAGKRAMEIGGLLLGRLLPGGRTVLIEDLEVVPCEHLRGASYTLSPRNRKSLGARIARHRGARQVVGYFRSHTRPGLYLDQDDLAVISTCFPEPSKVFLVVKPSTDGAPEGGFFFWEDGDINRKTPYRRFPFDREALLAGGRISDHHCARACAPPHGNKCPAGGACSGRRDSAGRAP